jgi:hypothetical protein
VIGPDLYTFEALWRHYRRCRRTKRNTLHALAFEMNAEANLLALQQALRTHTYRPERAICFVTDGPKPREVFAADFRDRVVHHLLVSHAGHLRHSAAWRAWAALWERYVWLTALFVRQGWALEARWSRYRLARVRRFQAQYWHLVRRAGDDCLVFFPCGRFIEFYGP